ncbi:hypothetical protein SSX86_012159 [Deinandra increscens subsp. villosa]|uniref:Uncharacterized protein n=1 Tax=Deinandra increscens subsp. villosa TaxID=3103831 RepID=A0AAP0DBB7_9ASTR
MQIKACITMHEDALAKLFYATQIAYKQQRLFQMTVYQLTRCEIKWTNLDMCCSRSFLQVKEDHQHFNYSNIDVGVRLDDHWTREATYDYEDKYFTDV